jgi:2-phospho-L-lactate/phosphoenolpyruvate guanylyltransferase
MIVWAIIPVKPLRDSKSRLAHILSPDERGELTASMLRRTLSVLRDVEEVARTLVVSRDTVALKIARAQGAQTYGEGEKQGLNLALTRAAHVAAAHQANGIIILPADLPLVSAEDIQMMFDGAASVEGGQGRSNGFQYPLRAAAICPDQHNEGTNALLLRPPTGFTFQYGPDSLALHLAEAARLGIPRRIVHAPGLKFDLDNDEDWRTYQSFLAVSSN